MHADDLLESIDLELWLDAEGIDYRTVSGSRGQQYNLRACPLCGTEKWKVYLNAETGLGNCFSGSCEAKFNKWTFIQAHLGIKDPKATRDALRTIAREQGWKPVRRTPKAVELTGAISLPESVALPIDGRNLKYLDDRGINAETAKRYELRLCLNGHHQTKLGEETKRQWFGNRVIIPVFDLDGNLVTFQGRDIIGTSDRKYLFPMGLPATARYLFDGHNATGITRVVVGEGAFDVMAIKLALDHAPDLTDIAAIGSFGKHLSISSNESNDQLSGFLELKRRGLREVIICWDGEYQAAFDALKAARGLKSIGLKVRISLLPQDKDPNEIPASTLIEAIRSAEQFSDQLEVRWRLNNPYKFKRATF